MLNYCSLMDMGFSGPRFSWTNLWYTGELIQESRTGRWQTLPGGNFFPNAHVNHLTSVPSDHCPLLLKCNPEKENFAPRPFRFELMWMDHPDFRNLMSTTWDEGDNILTHSIRLFTDKVQQWNKDVFGNIFFRRKRVLARLNGTQRKLATQPSVHLVALEVELRKEYGEIL